MIALGEQVGPYRIVGALGEGGMGVVYRAVHALLHRPAAIKVLRAELGGSGMADRFLTEARATTAIRHPGIVEVYDYGHTATGCAYIAMELLDGQTLAARLARGPLGARDAALIARRIAAPLTTAHACGVIHRDLKPDNVFLVRDPDGGPVDRVKLLDFGIARLGAAAHHTTVGVVMGTPAYMSPEQCRGLGDVDHRTDLYALGCILFEMLAGEPPFAAGSTAELMAAQIRRPPPDLGKLACVPGALARLVRDLLAKQPTARPPSASAVIDALDAWLAPPAAHQTRRPRRLGPAVALALGIAVPTAALAAYALAPAPPSPPVDHAPPPTPRPAPPAALPPPVWAAPIEAPSAAPAPPDAAPRRRRARPDAAGVDALVPLAPQSSSGSSGSSGPSPSSAVGVDTPVAM